MVIGKVLFHISIKIADFYRLTFVKPASRLFVKFLVLGPLVHIIDPDQPNYLHEELSDMN